MSLEEKEVKPDDQISRNSMLHQLTEYRNSLVDTSSNLNYLRYPVTMSTGSHNSTSKTFKENVTEYNNYIRALRESASKVKEVNLPPEQGVKAFVKKLFPNFRSGFEYTSERR